MNNFGEKTENAERQEAHEIHEAQVSPEKSSEEMCEQIKERSKKEVMSLKEEGEKELLHIEANAEKDGLTIDNEDREEIEKINNEASIAEAELAVEISPVQISNMPPPLPVEYLKQYPDAMPITMPAGMPPPLPEEYKKLHFKACSSCGKENGMGNRFCDECGEKFKSVMKEKVIENAELLTEKEASKKLLSEERIKLAQEIREQRNSQRDRLSRLKNVINVAQEKMESEDGDKQFGRISELQSAEADLMAKRFSSGELDEQDAEAEKNNLSELIANSENIALLKKKLEEHYAKADLVAKKKFESVRKTVEQTLLRNNAFIVHAIQTRKEGRHNANSNISQRATIEDDIDILLSLEPSISTSSVIPGVKHGLWENRIGVILGGGEIMGGAQTDNQTQVGGIRYRNGTRLNSDEIDALVSNKEERGYNELVVNNPKIFGFYQNATLDESGRMLGFVKSSKSLDDNNEYRDDFMQHMNLATKKGIPLMVMTPDRRLFEFLSINNEGEISFGSEITPAQVALGNAGLSSEKRVEIGNEVISKNLFRQLDHQKEAKGIISEIAGKDVADRELTREEYISYMRDNGERATQLPENLRNDREFMFKVAEFNPYHAYVASSQNLRNDVEFIKHVYAQGGKNGIYDRMPDNLKNNEDIAMLAIENSDFQFLNLKLANSPKVWDKLTDKLSEEASPESFFDHGSGNVRFFNTDLVMRGDNGIRENISERLVSDENFIKKLNEKYPGFKFENDDGRMFVIKIS